MYFISYYCTYCNCILWFFLKHYELLWSIIPIKYNCIHQMLSSVRNMSLKLNRSSERHKYHQTAAANSSKIHFELSYCAHCSWSNIQCKLHIKVKLHKELYFPCCAPYSLSLNIVIAWQSKNTYFKLDSYCQSDKQRAN